jgi:hypothetical protein
MVSGMRATRYPLAAARTQRDQAQQVAKIRLAEARARLAQAETGLQAAQATMAAVLAQRSATTLALPAAYPNGGCVRRHAGAAQIARNGAYAARLQTELNQLTLRIRAEQRSVAEHARAVRLAELTLADAHAQRELVERHHARFREAEHKASEHAAELEAEELRQHTGP